jgi:hypothetical protein
VVVGATRPDDEGMPEPTTVWMVRLLKGEMGERKGLLTLDTEGLVFRDASLEQVRVLPFDQVRRAKRVKGSPILLVSHDEDRGVRETAFYFTEPPPLTPDDPFAASETSGSTGRPLSPLAAARRTSKRRHMRDNVQYLTAKSGSRKPEINAWVQEIAARLGS